MPADRNAGAWPPEEEDRLRTLAASGASDRALNFAFRTGWVGAVELIVERLDKAISGFRDGPVASLLIDLRVSAEQTPGAASPDGIGDLNG